MPRLRYIKESEKTPQTSACELNPKPAQGTAAQVAAE
jgi:hypothetical protein